MAAPDSPRASESPPPTGIQGDLELELMGLANALYNVGATVIHDSSKDETIAGSGKPVGLRVYVYLSYQKHTLTLFPSTEVIQHLSNLDTMTSNSTITNIPIQVLADIDNSRNPMQLTRERLERAATENQFMNGKIQALEVLLSSLLLFIRAHTMTCQSYTKLLDEALCESFPDLVPYLSLDDRPTYPFVQDGSMDAPVMFDLDFISEPQTTGTTDPPVAIPANDLAPVIVPAPPQPNGIAH